METSTLILGISPGTRFLGFAVLKNGEVVHSYLKAFKGKWNAKKENNIREWLRKQISQYEDVVVAMKKLNPSYAQAQQLSVISMIEQIAREDNLPIYSYSNKDLKQHFCHSTRADPKLLMKAVVEITQDFMIEYQRELKNSSGYYIKFFEAIALTLLHSAKSY